MQEDYNLRTANENVVLKLNYGNDRTAYVSVQRSPYLKESEIGINSIQAKLLQLSENDTVYLSVHSSVPSVKRLAVSPFTSDDYEVLELLAQNVERMLLDQIQIVNINQQFVVWISDLLHVTVNVDSVDPVCPGRLDNLTEVVIEPPKLKNSGVSQVVEAWNSLDFLSYFRKSKPQNIEKDALHKYLNLHCLVGFNLQPLENLKKVAKKARDFNVFVYKEYLPSNFEYNEDKNIFKLNIMLPPVTNSTFIEENNVNLRTVYVKLLILEDDVLDYCCMSVLYISKSIFKYFDLKPGAKAFLEPVLEPSPLVNNIEICTRTNNVHSAKEKFKHFLNLDAHDTLVLNSEFVYESQEFLFKLQFLPTKSPYFLIDSDFVRTDKLSISDTELVYEKPKYDDDKDPINVCQTFGNIKQIIKDSMSVLSSGPENILLVGKSGTGKTTLTTILTEMVSRFPYYMHVETISCKTIKGKTAESLLKLLSAKITNLVYYQPSILILDDLNVICERVLEADTLQQESLHFNRVSEMLVGLLSKISKRNEVAVVATTDDDMKLNQHVFSTRGQHLFKIIYKIKELAKDDRIALMQHLFSQRCALGEVNLGHLAIKADGFVARDVVDFVDRAMFESLKDEKSEVTLKHCQVALEHTTALALKDIQLHSPGDRDFSDIGGLEDVKTILVECMMWPVQYPNLFQKAPLRMQSGLLLYGLPGTGKTILAGAAAKHCGLRLISIKGPELLSKYIGASEQAVRNVFEKAQSAKPCILFFDEFDSLAPRRGHDSTGVTDRVVNQLLTQLDGIESLTGVCVLAATSRPDLLDPALLRPGRFDRQILCPLPDEECRSEILKSLAKDLMFASDVNLISFAAKTTGFSGADLQSLLYTAQLAAVENSLGESKANVHPPTEINQKHLQEALKNTRPSLTREEIVRFQTIYARFQQGGDLIDVKSGTQKATLA